MNPIDFISVSTKVMKVYETFCLPLCKKFQMTQTSFDVLMFLTNNPSYNTARDICEIRGIRSGMASVAIDFLVKNGLLRKKVFPSLKPVNRYNRPSDNSWLPGFQKKSWLHIWRSQENSGKTF